MYMYVYKSMFHATEDRSTVHGYITVALSTDLKAFHSWENSGGRGNQVELSLG